MKPILIVVLTAIVAAGCVSTPAPRYYTLDMTPSGGATLKLNVEIESLRASEALARRNILIKKSPTEIEYYALDQWAAALSEIVGQKLEAEFGPFVEGRETLCVVGSILNFDHVDVADGVQAHARIEIEFRPEDASRYDKPLLKKTYDAVVPVEAGTAGAVVCGLSRCVEKIAADAAADANRLKP